MSKKNLKGGALSGVVLLLAAGIASAQNHVRIVHAIKQDISAPLRDLAGAANAPEPISPVPESSTGSRQSIHKDPAIVLNFAAMGSTGAFLDTDPNGAVGATQYVQWTNARYAVYSKTTGLTIVKPTNAKTLWLGFGGPCETSNAGDGIVLYDKAAQRWIISHHAGAMPYPQCFAISTTSDASGSYYRYAFQLTTQFPDWPKVGVWPDAYYITMNLMTSHVSVGAEVCALDRTSMLVGSPTAIAQCFTAGSANTDYVLMPADLDGSTPPPAGAPNYLLSLNTNSLDLFTFHVDWVTPANSTLSGPANIPVTPFTEGCNGGFCVPQLGSTQLLDAVGERVMYRLAYRNFSDHESLLATHTVNNSGGTSVGVRWYEIRTPATPVVYQSGTIQPDNNFRSMGSLAMDKVGNILIGYSVSSAAMYPASAFSGRLSTDALGTLEPETILFSGTGAQTGINDYHWGDY